MTGAGWLSPALLLKRYETNRLSVLVGEVIPRGVEYENLATMSETVSLSGLSADMPKVPVLVFSDACGVNLFPEYVLHRGFSL